MGYRKLFKAISLAILAGVLLAAAVFAATKAWRYHEYTTVGENGIAQTDAVTLRGTTLPGSCRLAYVGPCKWPATRVPAGRAHAPAVRRQAAGMTCGTRIAMRRDSRA